MPLNLRDHTAWLMPRLRLVLEAVIKHLGFIRRSSYWAGEQVLDFPLQNGIGLDANGVVITFFLQQTVQCRIGKGRIAAKEFGDAQVAIPLRFRRRFMLGERFHLASQTSVF